MQPVGAPGPVPAAWPSGVSPRRWRRGAALVAAVVTGLAGPLPPVAAVNDVQPVVVSQNPADFTPSVNDGVKAVVQAQFVADGGGVDFSQAAGLFLADDRLYFGSSRTGVLSRVRFTGGRVTSAATTVNTDGSWTHRAVFVPND